VIWLSFFSPESQESLEAALARIKERNEGNTAVSEPTDKELRELKIASSIAGSFGREAKKALEKGGYI
jgi:uroporphyrinogen-III synthase